MISPQYKNTYVSLKEFIPLKGVGGGGGGELEFTVLRYFWASFQAVFQ